MKVNLVIIGAGASGIGLAAYLNSQNIQDFVVLDKGEIGQNFRNWPSQTRLITPSFTSNGFGMPDLNAITPRTSPAYTLDKERLSGKDYAQYLQLISEEYQLPVLTHTEVLSIEQGPHHYRIKTNRGEIETNYIVMAVGEFTRPNTVSVKGVELACPYSEMDSIIPSKDLNYCVIGGNESGIDAAVHLANQGYQVNLYTQDCGLFAAEADPSIRLSPYTRQRYQTAIDNGAKISIYSHKNLSQIAQNQQGYTLSFDDGETVHSSNRPILATGFESEIFSLAPHLFEKNEDGTPKVTSEDESTIAPNVFLVGPSLRQPGVIFCYIYKFRQRFAPLVITLAQREKWPIDLSVENLYRQNQMYLDDLSCCQVECDC